MLRDVPERLGAYVVGEPVGAGAQATVFLAQDPEGRTVALKVRRAGDPTEDRRFLREFESMRLLRVPGVVAVHEAGVDGDLLWFSMDRVHGRPFHEAVLQEPYLPDRVDRTMALGAALLDTLAGLHSAGFAHRDIKPSNVLVDSGGGVHVLDFGIGETESAVGNLGAADFVMGTVPWMAPEQLANLPSDERADLFAVGLMLHEAIAGPRTPPTHILGWIPRMCVESLPPLASLYREVPLGLSHLIQKLLSVDPSDRPSARKAAAMLRRLSAGHEVVEAPEPQFVDPGTWWSPLENALGQGVEPVQILSGPAGSGRRRICEQLQRLALLDQIWTFHLHCRVDEVGGPARRLLERLVACFEGAALRTLLGDEGAPLRRMWPQIPMPGSRLEAGDLSSRDVVSAIATVLERLSSERPLLLVFHDVERVDPLTARMILALTDTASSHLGIILSVDPRWHRRLSRALLRKLQRRSNVGYVEVEPPTAEAAAAIASSLCPESVPAPELGVGPQLAVEAGLRALASWRGTSWPPANPALWPLVVRDAPLPATVYSALVGRRRRELPWVEQGPRGVGLTSETPRRATRVRLSSLERSSTLLARTWEQSLPEGTLPGDLAALWLLADAPERARRHAFLAAVAADRLGRFSEARSWLMILDAHPSDEPDTEPFTLAWVRARVALRTEPGLARPDLVDIAAGLAKTPRDERRIALLRAEYSIRRGEVRGALAHCLSVASAFAAAMPLEAATARLVAVQCRFALGQDAEAEADLERVRPLIERLDDPVIQVQHINGRAELARRTGDLTWSQALCQQAIKLATSTGYSRGAGHAAHRLAQVQRLLGRRRRAEQTARAAGDAFKATGDIDLTTESDLFLATLWVERGEVVQARRLLDRAIRLIRALHLDHLLPKAMRVALLLATYRLDNTGAQLALDTLASLSTTDDEVPAATARWWRARGESARASAVNPPPHGSYGAVSWHIEQARTSLMEQSLERATHHAELAREAADAAGYGELVTAACLILGAVGTRSEADWRDDLMRATASTSVELALGALELDAWRMERTGDPAAHDRWRTLRARAQELGVRPAVQEAEGWLGRGQQVSPDEQPAEP